MGGNGESLEIERKFLIRIPDEEDLRRFAVRRLRITQSYLVRGEDGSSRRVRKSEENGHITYTYTEKKRISGFTRLEREKEIAAEEYDFLLSQRDEKLRTIEKIRWCIPFEAHVLEIDVFSFWKDRALLEIELTAEEEAFQIPPSIVVLREVTNDPRYLNTSLAATIPMDRLSCEI